MVACSLVIVGLHAQSPAGRPPKQSSTKKVSPLSPFPDETQWTLELNNALVAPPAYEVSTGYFPIADDRIAAYDLATGTLLWLATARPRSALILGDGLLFIEQTDEIAALKATDGSVAWRSALSEKLAVPLAWNSGRIVAATATAALAFRASDGSLLWRHDLDATTHASPALAADRVFIPTEDGRVIALRADTGEMLWEHRLGAAANEILVADEWLFVGSNDNYLYCLSAQDGEKRWRARTGADVVSRPIVDEHRVYFLSLDNILRALNRTNGVLQWKRPLTFRPAWAPIKAFDALIVSDIQGPLRAFFLKDGTPAGEVPTGTEELAAPVFTLEATETLGLTMVIVTRHLATGAKVRAAIRAFDPPVLESVVPLPDVVPVVVPPEGVTAPRSFEPPVLELVEPLPDVVPVVVPLER